MVSMVSDTNREAGRVSSLVSDTMKGCKLRGTEHRCRKQRLFECAALFSEAIAHKVSIQRPLFGDTRAYHGEDLPRINQHGGLFSEVGVVTRPSVGFWHRYHLRSDRVEVDIPRQFERIGVLFNENAAEASLEDVANPLVLLVDVERVRSVQRLHEL